MKKITALTLGILVALQAFAIDYKATVWGAKSDGITDNTGSIQRAVDYIAEHGGGSLTFFVGRYLTGAIELKSNVTIVIEEGAVLVGSDNIHTHKGAPALLWAKGADNIEVCGKGTIECTAVPHYGFENCTNVRTGSDKTPERDYVTVSPSGNEFYASSFGIKSNGSTMNTRSIQKAIDFISERGGGKLIFKVGRYLTGSIYLKDNVTVELGEGAVIVGSLNPYDYDRVEHGGYGLFLAKGARNIAITGLGVIDGQGREVANNYLAQIAVGHIKDELKLGRPADRPHLIYFRECENVKVEGINLRNSACWTQTYDQCRNLLVNRVTVDSRAFWNNDGMDIVDCVDATIQNCFVNASDDGICLKSHSAKHACDNVIVKDNVITSSASAIKFGTFGKGGFKNIQILNNKVYDTFRSAIAIEAVDGGMAENIVVDGLTSTNTANPIFLIVGERLGKGSYMNNVTIKNVVADVPVDKPDKGLDYEGPTFEDQPRNICPCAIVGLEKSRITNVTIENVTIKFPGGADPDYAKVGTDELDKVPEMPAAYPEFSQFKELPAWGFYIRHAEGIKFNNVKLSATAKDYRPAIVLDDVSGSSFRKVTAVSPQLKAKIFEAGNCKNNRK